MSQSDKEKFLEELKNFVSTLKDTITKSDEWTVRGFIDIFRNVYPVSSDTKIISKLLELHLFPYFLDFANKINFNLELAEYQNWYPDLTFVSAKNPKIKFAVDLKTTYRDKNNSNFCNGFTLGSHGEYFIDRKSTKNIQYPYNEYSGHFCVGIIYSREILYLKNELKKYTVDDVEKIPAVIKNFLFFAEEKWKIASDKAGSGNTANIGSIKNIEDLIAGHGVFSLAGEKFFDDYWANFGKLKIPDKNGGYKKLSSFEDFLKFKGLPETLICKQKSKKKRNED